MYKEISEDLVNADAIDQYEEDVEQGDDCVFIETTFTYLASIHCKTLCGKVDNNAFQKVAEKYPDVLVRCCLNRTKNYVGCCDIKIKNEEMGYEIETLVGACGGSLRCDYCNQEWTYFETE